MYKALMLDIDGTIVPYDYEALPSQTVSKAILEASGKVTVSFVTGRGYTSVLKILNHIGLSSGYAAINNGSYIFDVSSGNVIYDQPICDESAYEAARILTDFGVPFYAKQFQVDEITNYQLYKPGDNINKTYMMFSEELFDQERLKNLFNKLSIIKDITVHKTRHTKPNIYGFNIVHGKATKAHAIEEILKEIHVQHSQVIGVGDSYNDFPLLMASGLKVAMGNALSDLKQIADYVAPSVADDGVVDVIDRYILNK